MLLFIDNIFRFTQANSEVPHTSFIILFCPPDVCSCILLTTEVFNLSGKHADVTNTFAGVGAAGPYPLGCRLPADAVHGSGWSAGAHHHHQQGVYHLCAGAHLKRQQQHCPAFVQLMSAGVEQEFSYQVSWPCFLQAIYVPADDLTDPAPATTFAHLDATTVLSRSIAELGIYPAVDPLDSTSRMLNARIIGQEHYDCARAVQRVLQVRSECFAQASLMCAQPNGVRCYAVV